MNPATEDLSRVTVLSTWPLFLHQKRWNTRPSFGAAAKRAAAWAGVAWLPLLAIALVQGGAVRRAFLHDAGLHARLLVSIPAMVMLEWHLALRLGEAVRHLTSELVSPQDLAKEERAAALIVRLRDSPAAQFILFAVVVGLTLGQLASGWRPSWSPTSEAGAVGLYSWLISLPMFRLLLLYWVWRLVLWQLFLFKVARLKLRIVATHPDQRGGLRFLSDSLLPFWWLALAIAAPIAAITRQAEGTIKQGSLPHYLVALGFVAALVALAVLAPLAFLTPAMIRAKRQALLDFEALTRRQSDEFEQSWFKKSDRGTLAAPDFSAVIDLGSSFSVFSRMRCFPVTTLPVLAIAAGALGPAVIALMFDHQLAEVSMKLFKVAFG